MLVHMIYFPKERVISMKKAIILGCPGSGKSTFARKLRDATGIPLYYLDMLWHKPDQTNVTREEFDQRLHEILIRDEWIIDGNYNRTIEERVRNCDTVFLFALPVDVCVEGARSRVGTQREDLPWVEEELDPEFHQFILDFRRDYLPEIYETLEKYCNREIIIFKSRNDTEKFLTGLDYRA